MANTREVRLLPSAQALVRCLHIVECALNYIPELEDWTSGVSQALTYCCRLSQSEYDVQNSVRVSLTFKVVVEAYPPQNQFAERYCTMTGMSQVRI